MASGSSAGRRRRLGYGQQRRAAKFGSPAHRLGPLVSVREPSWGGCGTRAKRHARRRARRASWSSRPCGPVYAVSRAYQLGVSLPDAPLQIFRDRAAAAAHDGGGTPRRPAHRTGYFRKSLLEYWNRQCPLTGVRDPALLRASHIVPWAECDDDAQRLDVYNGLLLSALWDAAFDAGKVTFTDEGEPLFHHDLGETERDLLRANAAPRLVGMTAKHAVNLRGTGSRRARPFCAHDACASSMSNANLS